MKVFAYGVVIVVTLAHSLAHFNTVPNRICTCKIYEETPDHDFWQCRRFTKERKNLTKGFLKRWKMPPLQVDMILTNMDPSDIYVLGAFIMAIKIRM
jgi:hypothetical protein